MSVLSLFGESEGTRGGKPRVDESVVELSEQALQAGRAAPAICGSSSATYELHLVSRGCAQAAEVVIRGFIIAHTAILSSRLCQYHPACAIFLHFGGRWEVRRNPKGGSSAPARIVLCAP